MKQLVNGRRVMATIAVLLIPALPALASEHPRRAASEATEHRGATERRGTVESLPSTSGWLGEWKVSGRSVRVDGATRIEAEHGPVATGARVEVQGTPQPDGSLRAARIEVEHDR